MQAFFFSCQNVVLFTFVGRVMMKSGIISSLRLQSSDSLGSGTWFFKLETAYREIQQEVPILYIKVER